MATAESTQAISRGDRVEWAQDGQLHSGTVVGVIAAQDHRFRRETAAIEIDGGNPGLPIYKPTSEIHVFDGPAPGEITTSRLAELVEESREGLMSAAKLADQLGANAAHVHLLNAVTHLDDVRTLLTDGVGR